MIALLISAFFISLAGAVIPGPVLAVAVAKGFQSPRGGFFVALGHTLIDAIVILIIYFGLRQFFEVDGVRIVLHIIGGALTVWMGIVIFSSRDKKVTGEAGKTRQAFLLGVIATIFNPMFWIWWATVGSMFILRFSDYGFIGILAFILAIELPALIWYSFAGILAFRTNSYSWGMRFRRHIIAISGAVIIGFGLYFILSGIGYM